MTPIELWTEHVGLAKGMARKRARLLHPFLGDCGEDLEQAALMGLWIAALDYDENRESKFGSYAWFHIRGALNCERWRQGFWGFKAEKAKVYSKVELRNRSSLSEVADQLTSKSGGELDQFVEGDLVQFLIRQLRPQKAQVVARRFWIEGLSTVTIAHQMNLSVDRIEQIRSKAKKDLQRLAQVMSRMWEGKAG